MSKKAKRRGAGPARKFFETLPADITAERAVEMATAAGVSMSKAYFYALKSSAKKAGAHAPRRAPTGAALPPTPVVEVRRASVGTLRLSSDVPLEQAVIDAVAALGAERVEAVARAAAAFCSGH